MKKNLHKLLTGLVILCLFVANFYFLPKVFAGTLTNTTVLELGGASGATPMIVSTGQSFAIEFTPANTTGSTSVTVTFTGWTGGSAGSVNATQTVGTSGCTSLFPGTPTALPGSLTAAGSGAVVTISGVTALSSGTTYCTTLTSTSAVTNPSGAGVYSVVVSDGTDSQTVGIDVLTSGSNAYSITAVIAPTFTMALSGTTDSFSGNLSATAVTLSTGITTTINTNAPTGWFVWAKDSNAGLTSTSAAHTIPTVSTGSNQTMNGGSIGTEKYALGVSTKNTANYAYNSGTTGGGLSTSTYNEIAFDTAPASGVTFVTHELADISPTSPPAADYTDTITEIGAGSF